MLNYSLLWRKPMGNKSDYWHVWRIIFIFLRYGYKKWFSFESLNRKKATHFHYELDVSLQKTDDSWASRFSAAVRNIDQNHHKVTFGRKNSDIFDNLTGLDQPT